jgi:hypothetical protein
MVLGQEEEREERVLGKQGEMRDNALRLTRLSNKSVSGPWDAIYSV